MTGLKAERLRRGWPQRVLAAKAELDQSLVSRIESGLVVPYRPWRVKLARALDWPEDRMDDLFKEAEADGAADRNR